MYNNIGRYYDQLHTGLVDDIPFVLQQARQTSGPVLEPGCGSGRLLIPLARAGLQVTGVDNSPQMLARAEANLAAEPQALQRYVTLLSADVSQPYLKDQTGTFGLGLFSYNTFMHFDNQKATAVLRQVNRLLKSGAHLLLDLENPFYLASLEDSNTPKLEQTWLDEVIQATVSQYSAYHVVAAEQIVDVNWTFKSDPLNVDTAETTTTTMRYHYRYPHQLELLLRQTGFQPLGFFGNYKLISFSESSKRLLVTAVKKL